MYSNWLHIAVPHMNTVKDLVLSNMGQFTLNMLYNIKEL